MAPFLIGGFTFNLRLLTYGFLAMLALLKIHKFELGTRLEFVSDLFAFVSFLYVAGPA